MFHLDKCSNPKCTRTGSVALNQNDKVCNVCKKAVEIKKEEEEKE